MVESVKHAIQKGMEHVVQEATKNAPKAGTTATESSSNWLGRTMSTIGHGIKDIAIIVKNAFVSFAKSFANHAKTGSGYFVGGIGAGAGLTGLIVTNAVVKENTALRVGLSILFAGVIFASTAVMFAFGKNPVNFSRSAAAV